MNNEHTVIYNTPICTLNNIFINIINYEDLEKLKMLYLKYQCVIVTYWYRTYYT